MCIGFRLTEFETNFYSGTTAAYIHYVKLYKRYGFLDNRSWPIIYLGFIFLSKKWSLGHAWKMCFTRHNKIVYIFAICQAKTCDICNIHDIYFAFIFASFSNSVSMRDNNIEAHNYMYLCNILSHKSVGSSYCFFCLLSNNKPWD